MAAVGELGSLIDFAEQKGLAPDSPGLLSEYTVALGANTGLIAERRGMTVDQLHASGRFEAEAPDPAAEPGI